MNKSINQSIKPGSTLFEKRAKEGVQKGREVYLSFSNSTLERTCKLHFLTHTHTQAPASLIVSIGLLPEKKKKRKWLFRVCV